MGFRAYFRVSWGFRVYEVLGFRAYRVYLRRECPWRLGFGTLGVLGACGFGLWAFLGLRDYRA